MKKLALVLTLVLLVAFNMQSQVSMDLDIGAGLYVPTNQAYNDIYGTSIVYDVGLGVWIDKIGIFLNCEGFSDSGTPYTAGKVYSSSADITVTTGTINLYYNKATEDSRAYFGLGFGTSMFNEAVLANGYSALKDSKGKVVQIVFGGKSEWFFVELKLQSIKANSDTFGSLILVTGITF